MYLKRTQKKGRTYLSVVRSYRDSGTVRTKTVESLGYLDELADRFEDPLAHFTRYVEQLNERERLEGAPLTVSIAPSATIPCGEEDGVQLGSAVSLAYLDAFGVGDFFSARTARSRGARGKSAAISAYATAASDAPERKAHEPQRCHHRACHAASNAHARKAHGDSARKLAPLPTARVFELLTCARMMHAVPVHETWGSRAKFPRACPMSLADLYRTLPAIAAESHALVDHLNRRYENMRGPRATETVRLVFSNYVFRQVSGLAASGPDEAPDEQSARLCLVIDSAGIPLEYRIVPRELTAMQTIELVESVKATSGARRVTLVAAQIPYAEDAIDGLLARGNDFVLLLPPSDFADGLRDWISTDDGYVPTHNKTYRIKSRTVQRTVADARRAGMRSVAVKEIALRSAAASSARAFCIASSEATASDAAVFNIYRELWRVHEPFHLNAADFISVPYPVDVKSHMEAHFLICYTAFFMLRVLRHDMGWSYNAARVADALLRLEGMHLERNWYLFGYRSEVTDAIEKAAGMDLGRRIMSRADIRSAIARMKRTIQGKAR